MSIRLNIQRFTGNGGSGGTSVNWSAGVKVSVVQDALKEFDNEIEAAIKVLEDYADVDAAITKGWSGTDRDQFLVRFHNHVSRVVEEIKVYQQNVHTTADNIMEEWDTFQAGHIN